MPRAIRFLSVGAIALVSAMALFAAPGVGVAATCLGHKATIVGTNRGDRLVGTTARDVIVGKGGGDRVYGRDGKGTGRSLAGEMTASKVATVVMPSTAREEPIFWTAAMAPTRVSGENTFSNANRLFSTGQPRNGTAHTRASHSISPITRRHSKTTSIRYPPLRTESPVQGLGMRRRGRIRPWLTSSARRRPR